ncbi:MAG TPA: MFS transporter [Nocardioides sp.]|nr:MFS transporter [Nocardioides sp.]
MTDTGRAARLTELRAQYAGQLAVGSVVLVLSMLAFVRIPLLPELGDDLSMSAADLGLMTTIFAVGRLCADIPAGRLSDLSSASRMLGGAAALLGVASLALALAQVSAVVLVAAFFLGVSSATVNTTGMVYFAEHATTERRGRSMAGFSAALLGGQAFGPALGGVLAAWWGWRAALVISAAIAMVVAAAAVLRSLRRRRTTTRAEPDEPALPPVPHGLPLREQAILYSVPFVMFFTFGSMPQTLVPIIGADDLHLDVGVIGLLLGVGGACKFIGAMVGGTISDRVSRKAALIPALLGQAAGVALLAVEGTLWAWVAALIIMSLASFAIGVAATMLVDRTHGRRAGRRLGPYRFAGDLGLIAGPITASLVYEHWGQRPAALLVAGVVLACALASILGLRETRWLDESSPPRPRMAGLSGEEQ